MTQTAASSTIAGGGTPPAVAAAGASAAQPPASQEPSGGAGAAPQPPAAASPTPNPPVNGNGQQPEPPSVRNDPQEPAPQQQAIWPDDWRSRIAGEDAKLAGVLQRYASMDNFLKAQLDLRGKVNRGEFKPALVNADDPDEVAAYQKAWGIPDKPEGYGDPAKLLPKIEGYEWSDTDKADVGRFLQAMHKQNATPAQVKGAIDTYVEMRTQAEQQMQENAARVTKENKAAIQREWGRDFKANATAIKNDLIATLGAEGFVQLADARMADGTLLGDHPLFLKYAAQAAKRVAEDPDVIVSDLGNRGVNPQDRMRELSALQDSNPTKYNSKAVQDELTQLSIAVARQKGMM